MDRFGEYLEFIFPDPQEARVIGHCEATGHEIYEGESYILLPDGTILRDDMEAISTYIDGSRIYSEYHK